MKPIPVSISRRLLWPKRYLCDYVSFGTPDNGVPSGWLFMVLTNRRKVMMDVRGRTVIYGREAFENEVERASNDAGQKVPVKGVA